MTTDKEQGKTARDLLVGGLGGAVLGGLLATLAMAVEKAKAAPPDEKIDYLIECLLALAQVLAHVAESNAQLIVQLQQWLAAQGVPPAEGVEVTVLTPWVAKEPEEIYHFGIRTADTFYSNKMVDWTRGKRLVIKVESSLNEAVQIQIIGNTVDDMDLATDIGPAKICPANDNISLGPTWEQWCPYIGVKIVVETAPASGLLTISAVTQE